MHAGIALGQQVWPRLGELSRAAGDRSGDMAGVGNLDTVMSASAALGSVV